MSNDAAKQQDIADDLIWGTQGIADYIGQSLYTTQYLIRTKAIPVGRLGPKTLFASKKQLQKTLTPSAA